MKIIVPSHDLDMVMRKTFGRLSERPEFKIYIAGPNEEKRPQEGACIGIDSPKIKSKFTRPAIKDLRRKMKELDIDIAFSASTSGLSNALMASIGLKVKNVGYRGTQAKVRRTDPTFYLGLLNPRVRHIVCETTDIHENLKRYINPNKLSGMPKPYDLEWVANAIKNPKTNEAIKGSNLRCIYIGITEGRPHKGLNYLLDAMRQLVNEGVTLTVIGRAGEEDMASAPANVSFFGSRPDAIDFLPTHDLFILPSLRDASPRVVREAQACGVPCIVTDIPGARDLIISNGKMCGGFTVSPGDADGLAEKIRELMGDKEQLAKMGQDGKRNIKENYALGPYVDYYAKLFKSL